MSKKTKTKTLRIGHFNQGKLNRHLRRGWTIVNTRGGALGTVQVVTLAKEVEK